MTDEEFEREIDRQYGCGSQRELDAGLAIVWVAVGAGLWLLGVWAVT